MNQLSILGAGDSSATVKLQQAYEQRVKAAEL